MARQRDPLKSHAPELPTLADAFVFARAGTWRYCIGRMGTRWVAFALETGFIGFWPEVSVGYELGVPDRDRALLLATAIAADPEGSYPPAEEWFVPPQQRGDPEALRCRYCDRVGCDGTTCHDWEDADDEPR